MNIQEQLTLYPELSGDERRAVEVYVAEHPEWQPPLEEAKKWDKVLADVRRLGENIAADEALAYYVTTAGLQRDRAPQAVKHFLNRIEERVASDPALAVRMAEMKSRMRAIEERSPASAQFERLRMQHRQSSASQTHPTGPPAQGTRPPARRLSNRPQGAPPAETNGRSLANGRSAPASAGVRPRQKARIRRATAAVLVVVTLYGALYIAGDITRPSYERLADFSVDELSLDGYENVRGEDPESRPQSSVELYVGALHQLRGAKTSVLGLFPRYNDARLDSAATLLRATLVDEPEGSFLFAEATFLLGKTELARGRIEAATEAFNRVISARGRRSPEARRLLEKIRS